MNGNTDIVALMQSMADENSTVAPFYTQTQDYYDAINQAQQLMLAMYTGGQQPNWNIIANLLVNDTLSDGGSLTQTCYKPIMITDSTNHKTGNIVDAVKYRGYRDITIGNMLQGEVENQTLKTIPSGLSNLTLYYLRYPLDISPTQQCELSPIVYPQLAALAFEILIHKDIDAPYTEMIETERNKTELLKQKTGQVVAPLIPYQTQT